MVKEVNVKEFDELLANSPVPVVCDFFASWCGPCKMLAPVMEQVSEELDGKATFVKVNVDNNMELAARYGIMSIPLVMVFVGGQEAAKTLGYMPYDEALEFVSSNL